VRAASPTSTALKATSNNTGTSSTCKDATNATLALVSIKNEKSTVNSFEKQKAGKTVRAERMSSETILAAPSPRLRRASHNKSLSVNIFFGQNNNIFCGPKEEHLYIAKHKKIPQKKGGNSHNKQSDLTD